MSASERDIVSVLSSPDAYEHAVSSVEHLETHISHVFLTGEFAYKLKKRVKFDFLDFSRLEFRKRCCEAELRLNSRYAPALYLSVLPISSVSGGCILGDDTNVVDFVVKMRQFDQESLFDRLAERNALGDPLLLEMAEAIASFHENAAPAPDYWGIEQVRSALEKNLQGCREFCPSIFHQDTIDRLSSRSAAIITEQKELIVRRQKDYVKECHGDLHLRNMCIFDGKVQLFDGIEFNPELSHIDVWADLAFFLMDLRYRGLAPQAALVWNRYLQQTDDFEGFRLLGLYTSFRAAVRARISALQSTSDLPQKSSRTQDASRYLELALQCLQPGERQVIAVGGFSGSGKSTLATFLSRELGAVHIRSDAVRKHLCNVPLKQKAPADAYTPAVSARTYEGMLRRTAHVVESDGIAVLDAVYQSEQDRLEIEKFAQDHDAEFTGIWCTSPAQVAEERIRSRRGDISDADQHVLSSQIISPTGRIDWFELDTTRTVEEEVEEALKLCRRKSRPTTAGE